MNNKFFKTLVMFLTFTILFSDLIPGLNYIISAEGEDNIITIYHTNDMHGQVGSIYTNGMLSQIGLDYIKTAKEKTNNSILIDAGDATQGTPMGKFSKGLDIVKLMNATGYDLMTLGNHEFDYGKDAVLEIAKNANFPVVSANTLYNGDVFLKDINNSNGCNFIKEINGKKIGFFGITTEETTRTTIPANLEGITFANEIETAQKQVNELKSQNVDIIIGITHVGIDSSTKVNSYQIAQNVQGIDIMIDGHSHSKKTEKVGNTLIQQTGTSNVMLGKIEIKFNNNSFECNSKLLTPKEVSDMFSPDLNITQLYDSLSGNIAPILDRVVGKSDTSLYGGNYNTKNISRMVETNLGSLIGDAMIYSTKNIIKGSEYEKFPIVALENGGAVRSKINSGYITMKDVLEVLPLDNKLSLQIVTPNIIYKTMERGVCKQNNPSKAGEAIDGFFGGFPQIAGMRIEYDINQVAYNTDNPSAGTGNRVTKIVLLNEDGSDGNVLDRNDENTNILFACNDYTITEYPMISDIEVVQKGDLLSNVLADYITKLTYDSKDGSFNYPLNQGRVNLLKDENLFIPFNSEISVNYENTALSESNVKVSVDGMAANDMITDLEGKIRLKNLVSGGHRVVVGYNDKNADVYVDETVELKNGSLNIIDQLEKEVKCVTNIISQIPNDITIENENIINFARTSYDSLTEEGKVQILNYQSLVDAENKLLNNSFSINNFINNNIIIVLLVLVVMIAVIIILVKIKKSNKNNKV